MNAEILLEILRKSKTKYKHVLEALPNELENLHELMKNDEYYPHIHITSYTGLVADPGGLVYFNGTWFLHYLWSPYHWIHGLKHWCLVSTKDFVNFTQHGVSIMPSLEIDQYGIYSGSAIYRGDEKGAELFFTGNVKKLGQTDDDRQSRIMKVFQDKDGHTSSSKEVLWTFDKKQFTPHFRDPKPFLHNNSWYFLLGAQTKDKKGNLAIFKEDGYKWVENLKFENKLETGYMLERPEIIQEGKKTVVISSPEGVEILKGSERVTAYTIGELSNDFELKNNTKWKPLDFGHDFYVPSIYKDDKNRNISIGWFGISRVECHPTKDNMWSHAMTLPRVITLRGEKLFQKPVEELKALRQSSLNCTNQTVKVSNKSAFELLFTSLNEGNFKIEIKNYKNESIVLSLEDNCFTLDRSKMSVDYYPELGNTREIENITINKVHLFIDASFLEVYINDGEYVLSSRIFIKDMSEVVWSGINIEASYKLRDINVSWKGIVSNFKSKKVEFDLPYTHK